MFDKLFLAVIIVLGVLAVVMFGVIQYQKNEISVQKNTILTTQIERDNAKAELVTKNLDLDNAKAVQDSLQNLLVQEKIKTDQLNKEIQDIDNAPETDNGDVSPVLRNSLERLRNRTTN